MPDSSSDQESQNVGYDSDPDSPAFPNFASTPIQTALRDGIRLGVGPVRKGVFVPLLGTGPNSDFIVFLHVALHKMPPKRADLSMDQELQPVRPATRSCRLLFGR